MTITNTEDAFIEGHLLGDSTKMTTIPDSPLAGVETKYYGPTNCKGSRIRVRRSDHRQGDPVKWISWDYALNSFDNHRFAAVAYIDMMNWHGDYVAAATEKGYTFARVPSAFDLERRGAF